jgi:hypothetical protein
MKLKMLANLKSLDINLTTNDEVEHPCLLYTGMFIYWQHRIHKKQTVKS